MTREPSAGQSTDALAVMQKNLIRGIFLTLGKAPKQPSIRCRCRQLAAQFMIFRGRTKMGALDGPARRVQSRTDKSVARNPTGCRRVGPARRPPLTETPAPAFSSRRPGGRPPSQQPRADNTRATLYASFKLGRRDGRNGGRFSCFMRSLPFPIEHGVHGETAISADIASASTGRLPALCNRLPRRPMAESCGT